MNSSMRGSNKFYILVGFGGGGGGGFFIYLRHVKIGGGVGVVGQLGKDIERDKSFCLKKKE